jgi:hypothetical protein
METVDTAFAQMRMKNRAELRKLELRKLGMAVVLTALVIGPLSYMAGHYEAKRQIERDLIRHASALSFSWNLCKSIVSGR